MDRTKVEAYLARLNAEQKRVVAVGPGLCVICGAPGSGKTTANVARIARLVRDGLPGRYILAVTFTRAAAAELTNRLLDLGISDCRFGTIHSLCWEFLQLEHPAVREGHLTVDEGARLGVEVRRILQQFQQAKRIPSRGIDIMELERFFEACKATGPCYVFGNPYGLNSVADPRQRALAEVWAPRIGSGIRPGALVDIYCEVELRRSAMNVLSYDDMVTWAWMQLCVDHAALQRWRSRWSAIVNDESQDQTPIQWDLFLGLAGYPSRLAPDRFPELPEKQRKSLTFSGQIAQSIYGFRSATPGIFIDLCTTPGVGLYELPTNYRSVPEICAVAQEFAAGEDWAIPAEIVPARGETGAENESVFTFTVYPHGLAEASAIAQQVKDLIMGGYALREIVVMARLSFFLNLVEIEMIRRKIPYVKRTGGGFIDSKEAQAILAYLRVAIGADPDGGSLKKAIFNPFRFVSKDELNQAEAKRVEGLNLLDALLTLSMPVRKKRSLMELRELLAELRTDVEMGMRPDEVLTKVINQTDFMEHLRKQEGSPVPDASKAGVLDELVSLAKLFETVSHFITFCDQLKAALKFGRQCYQIDEEAQREAVVLSTIHRMKGDQRETVFIGDVVQGRFPWNRATTPAEELRLMYTAITRAKNRVFVTSSGGEGSVVSILLLRLQEAVERVQEVRAQRGKTQRTGTEG